MKKFIPLILSIILLAASCACSLEDISTFLSSTEAPTAEAEPTEEPVVKPHFTVTFDENETFESDAAREAAAIIDGSVKTAVDGLNNAIERDILPECEIEEGTPRTPYKDGLTGLELQLYNEIQDAMTSFRDFSYDPHDYDMKDLNDKTFASAILTARNYLYWDNTRLFMYADINSSGFKENSCYYMPNEWLEECKDKDAVRHAVAVFDAVCDRIISKMPDGLTNTMKVYYFSRIIADRASYDYTTDSKYAMFQPYECLVRGKCVCQGYSRALQYLCRLIGIECDCAEGQAPGGGPHMWSSFNTTGGAYYIDVTWADGEASPDFQDRYFMMNYATLVDVEGYIIERFADY